MGRPSVGDAGMRRWEVIRRPLLRGTCQSYHSGAGVWVTAGWRWRKMREIGGGNWRRCAGPAWRDGEAGGARKGAICGVDGRKDVKMPLRWCDTEINLGGICYFLKHAL